MDRNQTLSPEHIAYREQQIANVLYDNARGAFFGSLFNIGLITFVLWKVYPQQALATWAIVGVILNVIRWLNCSRFYSDPERFPPKTWTSIHRFLTLLSGCLYGIFAIVFFNPDQPVYQALVIFLVGGMGAAAVGTYGVDLMTYRLFLFSSVLPLMLISFMAQTEVYITLSIMLITLMSVMHRAAKQSNATFLENFDMSYSLKYRATHDGLVGLLNREEFRNIFMHEQLIHRDHSTTLAMIFIDLDNFKILNDTLGHRAGDEALIKIGDVIRSAIRREDIAARFGGDEFMILIRSESKDTAHVVSEKIIEKVKEFENQFEDMDSKLGASIGIGYSDNPEIDFDILLTAADQACYQAKREGKGKICTREV